MWKLLIALPLVVLLAGCKDNITITVEDNGPGKYERESAMQDCVGQYRVKDAEAELRIACTQAVYGATK